MGSLILSKSPYILYSPPMTTLSIELEAVGAPAPAVTTDMPAEKAAVLEMDVTNFSTEELETRVEKLYTLQDMVGILRAKYLREIRDRLFPVTGRKGNGGDMDARMGWAAYLDEKFGAAVQKVNREIDGLNAIEKAQNLAGSASDQNRTDFNSYELRQLGTVAEDIRPVIAEALLTGEVAGGRAVKKAEKELLTVNVAPEAPALKKAPKALKINEPQSERTYSLATWRKVPEVSQEMEWMQKHLKKMRAAAMTYSTTCRKLNERFEDKQADNRNWPSVVTVMAKVWLESDFNFDSELQEIAKLIEAGDREYEQAMALSHGAANIVD